MKFRAMMNKWTISKVYFFKKVELVLVLVSASEFVKDCSMNKAKMVAERFKNSNVSHKKNNQ